MVTSTTRDTCPDLTFTKNVTQVSWENTGENLGSDRHILISSIEKTATKRKIRTNKITDWDSVRKDRSTEREPIRDIQEWTMQLILDVKMHRTGIGCTEDFPQVLNDYSICGMHAGA
ncbi:hypothetical protein HPB48_000127 [Haemaphysalis longicornis]|uniref:Uncharacterized protein n=1 Tax=Haemaphysalis longicornis TaxID=44386 RepID=A0A9J6G8Q2_HAELO|nr:hypothetical protein HPB48_000127 [Haemaphysalis longicornis]